MVGFERKTLYDMLDCIDTKRLTAYQIPGMKKLYGIHRFIIFEALWRSDEQGLLMEGFNHGYSWKWARIGWGLDKKPVMYSKLFRFLISIQLAGTTIIPSHSVQDTARCVVEYFHYFQKPWKAHRSQREIQVPIIPSLDPDISLVRRWAHSIQGVGLEFSSEAEKLFNSGLELAQSTEEEWDSIEGIGPATAKDIVRQIEGRKR
jgi:ERCC4-type nuclease